MVSSHHMAHSQRGSRSTGWKFITARNRSTWFMSVAIPARQQQPGQGLRQRVQRTAIGQRNRQPRTAGGVFFDALAQAVADLRDEALGGRLGVVFGHQLAEEIEDGPQHLAAGRRHALAALGQLLRLGHDFFLLAHIDGGLRMRAEEHLQPPPQFVDARRQIDLRDVGIEIEGGHRQVALGGKRIQEALLDRPLGHQHVDLHRLLLAHAMGPAIRCSSTAGFQGRSTLITVLAA